MNIFDVQIETREQAVTRTRGQNTLHRATIVAPHFNATMRRKVKGQDVVKPDFLTKPVSPLAGTFIISFAIALTYCIVQEENAAREKRNKKKKEDNHEPPVIFDIFLVQAVIAEPNEVGFSVGEYAGKNQEGHKRIAEHIKACADRNDCPVTVNDSGVILNMTPELATEILTCS